MCLFFMYYLREKYYKPVIVEYYIADCVSWAPRLTLLDLTNKWELRMRSRNGTRLYVGDLLCLIPLAFCSELCPLSSTPPSPSVSFRPALGHRHSRLLLSQRRPWWAMATWASPGHHRTAWLSPWLIRPSQLTPNIPLFRTWGHMWRGTLAN